MTDTVLQRTPIAEVQTITGNTVHRVASPDGEFVVPPPVSVRIESHDGGCYLLRLDGSGQCIADTWHRTIKEAMEQAAFEYEIAESAWREQHHEPPERSTRSCRQRLATPHELLQPSFGWHSRSRPAAMNR
jgi:hypothetical protein